VTFRAPVDDEGRLAKDNRKQFTIVAFRAKAVGWNRSRLFDVVYLIVEPMQPSTLFFSFLNSSLTNHMPWHLGQPSNSIENIE